MKTRNVWVRGVMPGLVALVACSPTPNLPDAGVDGGGVDAGVVSCATYASTYCDYLNLCEPGSLKATYGTVASCQSIRAIDCTTDLAAPGTGFTQRFLSACVPSLAGMAGSCDAGPVPGPVTTPTDPCALSGSLDAGAACGIATQCSSDTCNRVGSLCGTCGTTGQLGSGCNLATGVTCPRGMTCSGTSSTCVTTVAVGASCDLGVTSECVAGANCVRATSTSTGGTCQAAGVAVGTACSAKAIGSPDCWAAAGFFCDGTSHCAALGYAAPGATCGEADGGVSDTSCSFGTCDTTTNACTARLDGGQDCTVAGATTCQEGTTCVATGVTGTCEDVSTTCNSATLTANFTYQPSNISLTLIDQGAAQAADENVSSACTVTTDSNSPQTDCFTSPIAAVSQPGGATVNLVVVRSLKVQQTAMITVTGSVPLVIVSLSDLFWYGQLVSPSGASGAGSNMVGLGSGGGLAASAATTIGGGGGSFCGLGGAGGGATTTSTSYGNATLRPLMGGSSGGGGVVGSGASGGAVQLVAAGALQLKSGSSINVGGQGGAGGGIAADQNAGGGGSGGAILLEGESVVVDGALAANGGGGGGDYNSEASNANATATAAAGGVGGSSGAAGGAGGAGASINGLAGKTATGINAGAGGGGTGWIRVNTLSGSVGGTGVYSPAKSTSCTGVGTVRALGSGA